jgi:hypothetical protein
MGITSNEQILIVIIIGIIVIFFIYNRSEDFLTNTEAVNNIASLYNASNLTATNISATGNLSAQNINTTGISVKNPAGKVYFHTYDPGNGPVVQFQDSTLMANDINVGNINTSGKISDVITPHLKVVDSGNSIYLQTYNLGQGPVVQFANSTIFANDIRAGKIDATSLWVNGRQIA